MNLLALFVLLFVLHKIFKLVTRGSLGGGWYVPYYKKEPKVYNLYIDDPADRPLYPPEELKTTSIAKVFSTR